jgi:low affinity Fe/Cu permease
MIAQRFSRLASAAASAMGHWSAFLLALLTVIVWAACGPFFGFSATWQLVINTGTTVVTFLMVFLIQHDANRSDRALHLKLDELVRAIDAADDRLAGIEQETDT